MQNDEVISVEIAFGTSEDQVLVTLHVPTGTTVMEAIRLSAIAGQFPDVDGGRDGARHHSRLHEAGAQLRHAGLLPGGSRRRWRRNGRLG